MGEAKRRGQYIARELLIKFGGNPSETTPEEAEGYLYNMRQALGQKPFPQGLVASIWRGLRRCINVDLLGGSGGGVESKSEVRQLTNSSGAR